MEAPFEPALEADLAPPFEDALEEAPFVEAPFLAAPFVLALDADFIAPFIAPFEELLDADFVAPFELPFEDALAAPFAELLLAAFFAVAMFLKFNG